MSPVRLTYGSDPSQWVDRYEPPTSVAPAGAPPGSGDVVVIHGGFWRAEYTASLGAPLAADLARRGHTAWNVEYRRVGTGPGGGGGWTGTFDDVRAALALVPRGKVVTLGHSAGGQLAVWAAAHTSLVGAVSQAGVVDLVGAADNGVGGTAVPDLLGGTPDRVPDRYAAASPLALLPSGIPVRCVHAMADVNVPYVQSQTYVAAATRAGDDATLTTVDGDHFTLIDVTSPAWATIVGLLEDLLR